MFSATSILGLQVGDQYKKIASYLSERSSNSTIYLTNLGFETSENTSIYYSPDYLPIDISVDEILNVNQKIKSVKPLYFVTFDDEVEYIDIKFENENIQKKISIPTSRLEDYIYSEDLDTISRYADIKTSGEEGIYLTYNQYKMLGIDDITDQTFLILPIQIPINYTIAKGNTSTENKYYEVI